MNTIEVVTLTNNIGMELEISNYGATILSVRVPDKNKKLVNIVVGLKSPSDYIEEPYLGSPLYLGCSIGRFAGRISKGKFKVNNTEYLIYCDTKGVHLHGGKEGFDKKYWNIENVNKGINSSVTLSYFSKHLEEGYPGNLEVFVTYKLMSDNSLIILYEAKTDRDTHVNLTNHAYFNLNGHGSILNHELMMNSNQYVEVDEHLIPTGNFINSKKTRFDFSSKGKIGREGFIGFDNVFVLNKSNQTQVFSLFSNVTGIKMEAYSNQPAMVVFTPKKFPNLPFPNKTKYLKYPAICFEMQNFPDSPNNSNFNSTILKVDEIYKNKMIFKFTTIS